MKSILITGASSGIGRATAELFLSEGWRVGLLARSADKLQEIAATSPNAMVLPADVTDAAAVEAAFSTFTGQAGHLDVLFNNAGIFTPQGTIDEIPLQDWHDAVAVNLTGMFLAARCAFAAMRAQNPQGGRIINNGSVTYTATKHAVTGLTRTLSLDGRPFDIACGQIDIGNAETPMVTGLKQRAEAEGGEVPQTMDVMEAARSVLHMASMPLSANVQFMTVMATKMPYIGRG